MLFARRHIKVPLKSGPSLSLCYVRFINVTDKRVDVIWVNYNGVCVCYRTLAPRCYIDIETFVSHPWIFRNSDTWDRMDICKQEVYHIEPSDVKLLKCNRRLPAHITLPVYSLKELCYQSIRKSLSNKNQIYQLDIPKSLQDELYALSSESPRP